MFIPALFVSACLERRGKSTGGRRWVTWGIVALLALFTRGLILVVLLTIGLLFVAFVVALTLLRRTDTGLFHSRTYLNTALTQFYDTGTPMPKLWYRTISGHQIGSTDGDSAYHATPGPPLMLTPEPPLMSFRAERGIYLTPLDHSLRAVLQYAQSAAATLRNSRKSSACGRR